jgi:hypothetical protein
VHGEREDALAHSLRDHVATATDADFMTMGRFMWRLFGLAPCGGGDFVDVGSGTATANVVAYVALLWPNMFTRVHAVDVEHDPTVIQELQRMQLRVGAEGGGGAAVEWWTATEPDTLVTQFAGRQQRSSPVADLFAGASFVFCADLKFARSAVRLYRHAVVRSLVDYREVVYVTCSDPVSMPIDTPENTWTMPVGGGGDACPLLAPYARRCARFVARGNGVDTTRRKDTTFYAVVLRGPNAVTDVPFVRRTLGDSDVNMVREAERVVASALREVHAEVDAGAGAQTGGLSAESCSQIVDALCECEDAEARVDDDARVVVVGSGHGRLVLTLAVCVPSVRRVVGVEGDVELHAASVNVVAALRKRGGVWRQRLSGVSLVYAAAAGAERAFDPAPYSHVVLGDPLRCEGEEGEETRALFARVANGDAFRVLVCFCSRRKLAERGWPFVSVPLVRAAKLRATSGTCYVYRRESADGDE